MAPVVTQTIGPERDGGSKPTDSPSARVAAGDTTHYERQRRRKLGSVLEELRRSWVEQPRVLVEAPTGSSTRRLPVCRTESTSRPGASCSNFKPKMKPSLSCWRLSWPLVMIRTRSKPVSDPTNRLREYLLAEETELLLQALESSQQPQQPDLCGPFSGVSTLVQVQTALQDTDTQAPSPQFQRRLLARVLDQFQIPNATAFLRWGLISIPVTLTGDPNAATHCFKTSKRDLAGSFPSFCLSVFGTCRQNSCPSQHY